MNPREILLKTITSFNSPVRILKTHYAIFVPRLYNYQMYCHRKRYNEKRMGDDINVLIKKQIINQEIVKFSEVHTSALFQKHDEKAPPIKLKINPSAVPKKTKKSLKERTMDELRHYYHGFKLFCVNVRVLNKLVGKTLSGEQLTRREHNLLVRTIGDIFKLVPFSVFIIVPFLEFTLPVFLAIFPEMLPSTFQTTAEWEKKLLKNFKGKLITTKFLQETLNTMPAVAGSKRWSKTAEEFGDFYAKVRKTGKLPTPEEVLKFSKLFEDEITLDKIVRPQVVALCRQLGIRAIGPTAYLRRKLKSKVKSLQVDDELIVKEGINAMNTKELQEACKARGMRSIGISEERMKEQLQQWIQLSIFKNVPPSLLLMSQAFSVSDTPPKEKNLAGVFKSLPPDLCTATQSFISNKEGTSDYETEIAVILSELARIKEERMEVNRAEIERRKKHFLITKETPQDLGISELRAIKEIQEKDFTSRGLSYLEEALSNNIAVDKHCIVELRSDLEKYDKKVEFIKETMSKLRPNDIFVETIAARRLHKKLLHMIKKLDEQINLIEKKRQERGTLQFENQCDECKNFIKIEELLNAIKQRNPDQTISINSEKILLEILNKLDSNKDGLIRISKISKFLNAISDKEITIDIQTVNEYIDKITKEERIKMF